MNETRYTLRFPFNFGNGLQFPNLEQSSEVNADNLTLRMFREDDYFVIEVKEFGSEELAKGFLSRLWAGMTWVSLNFSMPFSAQTYFGNVTYSEDPIRTAQNLSKDFGSSVGDRVDGIASGNQDPIVYLSGKKIATFGMHGSGHVTSPLRFEDILPFLLQGINSPKGPDLILSEKIKIALELYNAYYHEYTVNARFLTLIMALEVLTTAKLKSKTALEFLEKWQKELEGKKALLQADAEEFESLEALEREIFFRKENSLRSQIRSLVYETLQAERNPEAQELAKQAVDLYDKRSTLVHEGKLSPDVLDDAERKSKQIVEKVLKAKIRSILNLS
jgi:hypothetical protein